MPPQNPNDPYEGLQAGFAGQVRELIRRSNGRVWINSGYRSVERQRQLWEAAVRRYGSEQAARRWVAPPGRSNHNHGMAVDLGGDLNLAWRIGRELGLVRPMAHEPWHFEPAHARHGAHRDAYTQPPEPTEVGVDKDRASTFQAVPTNPLATQLEYLADMLAGNHEFVFNDLVGDADGQTDPLVPGTGIPEGAMTDGLG